MFCYSRSMALLTFLLILLWVPGSVKNVPFNCFQFTWRNLTICRGEYERIGGVRSESVSKSFLMTRVRPGLIICEARRLSWALKQNVTRLQDVSFYTATSVTWICEIFQALSALPRLLTSLILLQIFEKKNRETFGIYISGGAIEHKEYKTHKFI